MADQEQLATVGQGVQAWNEWRTGHATITVDLRSPFLSEANPRETNLHKVDLRQANLGQAALR